MRPAAGITCVAKTTGRVLLLRRSYDVIDPGLWSCPAGGIDPDETPEEAAIRELSEEAGYDGRLKVVGSFQQSPTFWHFLAVVPTEFRARLNWENDEAGWFDLSDLPEPMHPGMLDALSRL